MDKPTEDISSDTLEGIGAAMKPRRIGNGHDGDLQDSVGGTGKAPVGKSSGRARVVVHSDRELQPEEVVNGGATHRMGQRGGMPPVYEVVGEELEKARTMTLVIFPAELVDAIQPLLRPGEEFHMGLARLMRALVEHRDNESIRRLLG